MKPRISLVVLCSLAALTVAGTSASAATPTDHLGNRPLLANPDAYVVRTGHELNSRVSVLRNDTGAVRTLVRHTEPAHGALTLRPDGTFRYVPTAAFSGVDTFTYTLSDAVKLYSTHLPPLATIGAVAVTAGGYGSSLYPVPGVKNEFYGLTDRGPNVGAPDGNKVEPLPHFDPAIGRFRLVDHKAVLERVIPLRAADGTPYNGRVNSQASTGETIEDLNGTVLPTSLYGYDSEGLVARPDGTFWVSDEYGPFITHFDRHGRAMQRLSPFDGSLPAELANRVPNKGMEGLTISPDGRTLVGMMQSALQQPDLSAKPANVTTLRVVTYDLRTHASHEYIYLLDDPKVNSGAVSEITALSDTTFLVDERDGNVEPGAYKKLFRIDLAGATDVGPHAAVPGATYDPSAGGLLVGPDRQTIDAYVGTDDTTAAAAALAAVGITVASKTLDVDLGGLLTDLDPAGGFFGHDKIEGVATTDDGRTITVSNDSDFGIAGIANTAAPYQLQAKILPNGQQDDGEFLTINTSRLTDPVSTATVSIFVTPPDIHH